MEHPGVYCKTCNKIIEGRRYKCIECIDFDLCESCELDYHSGHIIIRFTHPITQADNVFLSHISDQKPTSKPFLIQGPHDEEECHGCNFSPVNGFLYKCCDCTFNACRRCERNNHKCVNGSDHLLFRFTDPLSMNSVNNEFWIDILQIRWNIRNQVVYAKPSPIIKNVPVIHEGIKCNACHCDLIGRRYKCIDCRKYDLCSSCEPISFHLGHLLVRVGDAQLRSKQKQIFDKALRLRMSTYKENYARSAYCNSWNRKVACGICEESIRGYHYECLECDVDLCLNCQKKGWHTNHLMVRFTQPMSRYPVNQKFYEAVKALMCVPQSPAPAPAFYKALTKPNKSLVSKRHLRYRAKRYFTVSSQMPANQKLYDPVAEAEMPNGCLKSEAQILHEAITEFTASSPMSANQIHYESTTSPNMSTGSSMSANQELYEASYPVIQALNKTTTEPKMSNSSPVFTDQISTDSSTDLRNCSEVPSTLCSWYEAIVSTGSPVFSDKIFSESLTDLRTCYEWSSNQALDKATTEPKLSTDSPVFTDKIFSESLTDLRSCYKWSSNQALDKAMTEHSMSTAFTSLANLTLSESTADLTTDSPVSANHILSKVTESDKTRSSPTSPNQTLYEVETEAEMSSGQQLSRASSRTNLMGKKRGKAKSKKQFTSFVDIINKNDRITQERTIPKCVLCLEKPCEIIVLNCGHLCICNDCIDNYKKMSRQCPVCKFPIRSTHRAYY